MLCKDLSKRSVFNSPTTSLDKLAIKMPERIRDERNTIFERSVSLAMVPGSGRIYFSRGVKRLGTRLKDRLGSFSLFYANHIHGLFGTGSECSLLCY